MLRKISGPENPFPVGTVFTPRGKNQREMEVVDHLTTFNRDGDLVRFRYVAKSMLLGRPVFNFDVVHTTIARALEK